MVHTSIHMNHMNLIRMAIQIFKITHKNFFKQFKHNFQFIIFNFKKNIIRIMDPYGLYGFTIRMNRTDHRSIWKFF